MPLRQQTLQNLDDQSDVQTEQNDRLQDAAKQAEADRVRLNAEIAALKGQLEDTRVLSRTDSETAAQAKRELEEREREIDELRTDLKSALDDNDEVHRGNQCGFASPTDAVAFAASPRPGGPPGQDLSLCQEPGCI